MDLRQESQVEDLWQDLKGSGCQQKTNIYDNEGNLDISKDNLIQTSFLIYFPAWVGPVWLFGHKSVLGAISPTTLHLG